MITLFDVHSRRFSLGSNRRILYEKARPAGLGNARGERERVAALPAGLPGAASSRSEEARPAGLEPATPGLEVPRREATRGSTTLLPLISLTFGQAPDHPTPPRAATHCQSFVSRLSPLDNERSSLTDPSQVRSISS